jgi:hypothetical protein
MTHEVLSFASYPISITGSSAVGLAVEMRWRSQSVNVSSQTGGKLNGPCSCVMHFPYLPITGTTSRFGWTGPDLYYIFLTTETKTSYESVTRNHNDTINRHGYILTFSQKSSVKISSTKYFATRQKCLNFSRLRRWRKLLVPQFRTEHGPLSSVYRVCLEVACTSFMKISHLSKLGTLPKSGALPLLCKPKTLPR